MEATGVDGGEGYRCTRVVERGLYSCECECERGGAVAMDERGRERDGMNMVERESRTPG